MRKWFDCKRDCIHFNLWHEEVFIDGKLTGILYCQCTANKFHKVRELDECPFYEVKEVKND